MLYGSSREFISFQLYATEMNAKPSNYDKFPTVAVPDGEGACVAGWEAASARLRQFISARNSSKTVLLVECYPGVDEKHLGRQLQQQLSPALMVCAGDALLSADKIDALVAPYLGGDDPVFGFLCDLNLPDFFNQDKIEQCQAKIASINEGLVVVMGCGARLITGGDMLVYADLSRWEIQKRFRRNEAANLGSDHRGSCPKIKYKRAFFVDWRVADRWKRPLIAQWDFVLDTHDPQKPKLVAGDAVRRGLRHVVTRPFRVVPFFDPAPWGGQWMKDACHLPQNGSNYGWCFDCVPEENSLLLQFGDIRIELPSINLVFDQPCALLGESVRTRFGDEFPIRFDFLDTMQGGNLSLQVHPLTEYMQRHFGLNYTQDESYYILDAGPDAAVYLGLREGIHSQDMVRALELAQADGPAFPAEKFVNKLPAKKHDHFLIPAGTVHCSGRNVMVLEISATPYIFTFKMWDWARPGLDGNPRPIHLKHAIPNIKWDRTTAWVEKNLVNHFQPLASGDGWREEKTGLHELEFIETRRHWFTKPVLHHTNGRVNVLNLVAGDEVIVESPDRAFDPFVVHFAETFIIPAAVGAYLIRPVNSQQQHATMKAFVR